MTTKAIAVYSKLKLIDAFIAMNKLAEFRGFKATWPTEVQERWDAATELEADDPDMVAMVIALQTAWQWSDAERDALLASITVRTVQKIDRVAAQAELDALRNLPEPSDEELILFAKMMHPHYSQRLEQIAQLERELGV
jgi:hypothetical protein